MTHPPHLRIFGYSRLLGTGGQPVQLRTRKQLGLLVYLAFEGRARPVSRDLLIELFWSEVPAQRGRHSLSQALTALRHALGNGAVSRGGDAVRLAAAIRTDLDVLGEGAAPAGLDLAAPLRDLEKAGGAAFAHWVDAFRERCLRQVRSQVQDQLKAARDRGALDRVHERAAILYQVDPYSDLAVQALAEELLLERDVAGAIRLLRRHVAQIREEIGGTPHPTVARLLARLESGRVATVPEPARGVRREIFVGREVELARLESVWTEAQGNRLRAFLVSGPAGIGKSALIRRFGGSVAARAWPVVSVACQEIGRGIPFAAVSELIHALAREPGVGGTEPLWLAEASRVTPGLRALYPGIPEPPPVLAESVRVRVAEALVRMLEAVADAAPVLVVLDDIQHLDPASRDILHVFLRRVADRPLLVLAAARTEAAGRIAWDADEAPAFSWDGTEELAPLGAEQAFALIGELGAGAALPDAAVRHTMAGLAEGNPYLLEMLFDDWRANPADSLVAAEAAGDGTAANWRPPETMRRAFARQYRGLSPTSQHVLNLLAVAGRAMTPGDLAAAVPFDGTEVDHSALELLDRGIGSSEKGGISFKNELHRAFVYFAMSPTTREHFHARIARFLTDIMGDTGFQESLEASHHFLRAGMISESVAAANAGAEIAIEHGAPREAETAIRAALRRAPAHSAKRLELQLGRALVARGQFTEALQALDQLPPQHLLARERAMASLARATALYSGRLGDNAAINAAVDDALMEASASGQDIPHLHATQLKAEVAAEASDLEGIATAQARARHIAHGSRDPYTRGLATLTDAYCTLMLGDTETAGRMFKRLITVFTGAKRRAELPLVWNGLGLVRQLANRYDDALLAFTRAGEIAEDVGDADLIIRSWSNVGATTADRGRFHAAVHAYRRARHNTREAEVSPKRIAEFQNNTAVLALMLGNLEEAYECIQIAKCQANRSGLWRLAATSLCIEADYHLACCELKAGLAAFEKAQAHMRNKRFVLQNSGHFERWLLLWLWQTRGYDAVRKRSITTMASRQCLRVDHQIAVRHIEAWIGLQESQDDSALIEAERQLSERGLYGWLANLVAIHCMSPSMGQRLPHETPAQFVARTYATPEGHDVPGSIFEGTAAGAETSRRWRCRTGSQHLLPVPTPNMPSAVQDCRESTTAGVPSPGAGGTYPSRRETTCRC